jgi:hypothetical protein
MTERHVESCAVCGGPLEYLDEAAALSCDLCGRTEHGHVRCPQGHYLCEACHGGSFLPRLADLLESQESESPALIAEALMADPALPMLGCEHAHVAAGSLLQALAASRQAGVTRAHRDEALARTGRQAISAYCGLSGVCGVVPALGAAYSVLVGAQCGRGPQTRATMELVARLAAATRDEADPGCCKAYVRRGLEVAVDYLSESLGISLSPAPAIACRDMDRHPHGCRGEACAYHPAAAAAGEGRQSLETAPSAQDPPASFAAPASFTAAPAEQKAEGG